MKSDVKVPCSVVSTTPLARLNRRGNLVATDLGLRLHTLDETVDVVVYGEHRRAVIDALRAIADRLESGDVDARIEAAS